MVEDFVPPGQIGTVFSTFGITPAGQEMEEPMEENAMATGNVGGYAGSFPLGSTSVKRRPAKKKRKKKKNENIDMSLVNEVFELLIERGNIL